MSKEELSKQYADKKTYESQRNVYRHLPLDKQKELTCFDGYEIEVAYEDGFDKAVEEIRKEIERLILTDKGYETGGEESAYRDCAKELLSFIDSLQKRTKCI